MRNTLRILRQIGWIVLALNFCACRQTSQPPTEEDILAGKAFFTGPTPVSQHHGIQVIAYLKSNATFIPIDTTFTDTTGFYSFGKPAVDGVYVLTAHYLYYYPDTLTVKFHDGPPEGRACEMYIRQKVRIKFTSDKNLYRLADSFIWTVDIINISNDTLFLPNESWFDYYRWHRLAFVLASKPESKFFYAIGGVGHFPPCDNYYPGATITLTRSAPISAFTDESGNKIGPGSYLFYASASGCLRLEWNGRLAPAFEPVKVEIIP